jgi:hypothetical protein
VYQRRLTLDDPSLGPQQVSELVTVIALDLDVTSPARSLRKALFRGRLSTTVTVLPLRPAFSIRRRAVIRSGTDCSIFDEQRQLFSGHPQVGQTLPLSVE